MAVSTKPHETGHVPGRQRKRITSASFGLVILLVIQYVLGISYNLYGAMPTANKKIGIFSTPLLAFHVIVGTLLVFAAIYLLVLAIRTRSQLAVITSVAGLLAIIVAWVTGSAFVQKGGAGYSMAMGVMTAVALLCYLLNVWVFGGHRSE